MKQYNGIKAKYPDALLLFRVGDFYETFGQDAVKASKILNITLTKRGAGSSSETELAGFPHHSLNTYLPKLVKSGLRVAICDQLEDPKLTKNIVKRGVTELITPGVSMLDEVLEADTNNFLSAVHFGKKVIGISFLDLSTGEFICSQGNLEDIQKLIQNFNPSEILVEKQYKNKFKECFGEDLHTFYLDVWVFQKDYALECMLEHFKVNSLKGFGVENMHEAIIAANASLYYLGETQPTKTGHIHNISRVDSDKYVWLDKFTVRNLELNDNGNNNGGLLKVIDSTVSPMGARLIKRWLSFPLINKKDIETRLDIVECFVKNNSFMDSIVYQIKQISDIERLASKVATERINPRELSALKNSLKAIEPIKKETIASDNNQLNIFGEKLDLCSELIAKINSTLSDTPPVSVAKGGTVARGVNEELDSLVDIFNTGKSYLDDMVKREIEKTGITSLKISFNNVFGYYIEVRNTHRDKVPEYWHRKQTLVNAERYITEELKEYESKILGAEEKILKLEHQIYNELVSYSSIYITKIQENSKLIATIDCLVSFAANAMKNKYSKPSIEESNSLEISGGRHPVIESQLGFDQVYIPNDISFDTKTQQIIMITGPNMSGKSAILRQTALIVIMAQMGSYIPADAATIGVVDKIFTRVGASDNLSMGESTFMVEMNETSSILNNLSKNSLILLDEIGRGTSTYDGISIAWAISEYLHEHPSKPKTLFATHYHELNNMTKKFEGIKNFNVSVKELKDKVVFLRKLVKGGSEHSFGIHVAKLAGMPSFVVKRAARMLKELEENKDSSKDLNKKMDEISSREEVQLSLFNLDDPMLETIRDEIDSINIDTLTPIEALMKLNEIKRLMNQKL